MSKKKYNLKNGIKHGWKWTKRLYGLAFLSVCAHAGYDFVSFNRHNIDDKPVRLQIRKYEVDVNGVSKRLTLSGETHCYNKKEHEMARKLVDEHDQFASELGEGTDISILNHAYGFALGLSMFPEYSFYILGSGRVYDNIREIAEEKGFEVNALEKDPFKFMSFEEKAALFGNMVLRSLKSPLSYYEGRDEGPFKEVEIDFYPKDSLIYRRDAEMTNNLIYLLERDDVDNLLASVGNAHLEGIIANLSEKIELKERKD